MTRNSNRVASAWPAGMDALIAVMALAADPVARWMYPDAQRYLAYFGRFIRAFASKAFSSGTAWCIEANLGSALGLPSGVKPHAEAIAAIVDESVPPHVMPNVNAMFGEMTAYYPHKQHWHLPTVGIDPLSHRKALGSALLKETLRGCDQEHTPAYLESSNPANTMFYRRLGFEALGVIRAASLLQCSRCCEVRADQVWSSKRARQLR